MKEIMAIIRMNKISATKNALAEAGFPSFTCRKVMGRGKKSIDPAMIETVLELGELPVSPVGEYLTETARLIPKRYFTLFAQDEDVKKIIDIIMDVNSTGSPGDGKIFVIPIEEGYRIRNGEKQMDSESY